MMKHRQIAGDGGCRGAESFSLPVRHLGFGRRHTDGGLPGQLVRNMNEALEPRETTIPGKVLVFP